MVPCPRCEGPIAETTAVCPHCRAYVLEWDPARGRLGPAPRRDEAPRSPAPPGAIFGEHRQPRPLDSHRSLTVLRWLCGVGMAAHGLAALTRLVDADMTLVAWLVVWLPLDALWRSTR